MANLDKRSRKQQVLDALAPGEWVDGPALANEQVGGSEGLRRLREMRDEGYVIDERKHPDPARDIWQYRLVSSPTPGGLISPVRNVNTNLFPQPVSPLRQEAQPKRVTVADVPAPEVWYCAECGDPTSHLIERLLGGWAVVLCPFTGKRATGLPTKPAVTRGHPVPKVPK